MLTLCFTNFKVHVSFSILSWKEASTTNFPVGFNAHSKYNWCPIGFNAHSVPRFLRIYVNFPFMIFLDIITVTLHPPQTHTQKNRSSVPVAVGYGPWEVVYLLFSVTLFLFQVQLTWKIVETGSNYPKREFLWEVLEKPVLQLVMLAFSHLSSALFHL